MLQLVAAGAVALQAPPLAQPRTAAPVFDRPTPTQRPRGPTEYDLNVGALVDALKTDYPQLLEAEPDLSQFMDELTFSTPIGASLQGIAKYRRALDALRWARKLAVDEAEIGQRIV